MSNNILLIGEHCIDVYHYGTCNRLNPEAPVPILDEEYITRVDGMASNVKNNLLTLGFKITHYKNDEIIEKHRLVDLNYKQQLLRYDRENKISKLDVKNIKGDYDIVIISDYDKGLITRDVAEYICNKYKNNPIFVDSKKNDLTCYSNCFLKINNKEYENLLKYNKDNCELIITNGRSGATYNCINYPAPKVEVYDVCGAGDVFLAGMAYGFSKNEDIVKSIKIANILASISVSKFGTYVLDKNDINKVENHKE
tara:strand:+ start:2406 stop:3167 length:762 start_codon:yes stop_codon:yes gene_type:complete